MGRSFVQGVLTCVWVCVCVIRCNNNSLHLQWVKYKRSDYKKASWLVHARPYFHIINPTFCLHCGIMYSITFLQQTNIECPIQQSTIRLANGRILFTVRNELILYGQCLYLGHSYRGILSADWIFHVINLQGDRLRLDVRLVSLHHACFFPTIQERFSRRQVGFVGNIWINMPDGLKTTGIVEKCCHS